MPAIVYNPVLDRSEGLALHLGCFEEEGLSLVEAQRALDRAVLAAADLVPGSIVVDVGCGLGSTLWEAARQVKDLDLTGVNLDESQLLRAKTLTFPQPVRWIHADACVLPLPDAFCTHLLCVEAAFHFSSRRRFLEEAARVLRPGGRLVMTDLEPSQALRALKGTLAGREIERRVHAGAGPWPDFWGEEQLYVLELEERQQADWSRETLPSWRAFLGREPDADHQEPQDPIADACHQLGSLQEAGLLRVILKVFQRR
jgi:MPBQ/MSBQ methyltransferase